MNESQNHCLALMDIDRWVRRDKPVRSPRICVLIADGCSLPLNHAENRLLNAILHGVGIEKKQVELIDQWQQAKAASLVLVFGHQIAPPAHLLPQLEKTVMMDGLTEVLSHPIKKKQLYLSLLKRSQA
ncbi:MAG: hypothetical protein NTW08_09845 [Gammaproteobacteria bacterium]|nr:hypothetical protein [Gammaproteobacteria bacterium]